MVSLELLTVLVVAPLACLVCYDIAKKNPRANILMIIIATAELYGGTSLWSRLRSPEAIQKRARGRERRQAGPLMRYHADKAAS